MDSYQLSSTLKRKMTDAHKVRQGYKKFTLFLGTDFSIWNVIKKWQLTGILEVKIRSENAACISARKASRNPCLTHVR